MPSNDFDNQSVVVTGASRGIGAVIARAFALAGARVVVHYRAGKDSAEALVDKMAVENDQPARVKIRGKKLEIMKEYMDASDAVRIQYASTYAQVSNYWKYFIGQTEQLQKNKVWDKKMVIEKAFASWVNGSDERKKEYGTVLTDMEGAYTVLTKNNPTKVYFFEAVYSVAVGKLP